MTRPSSHAKETSLASPIKLYRNPKPGYCHGLELMMPLLGVPFEAIDLDLDLDLDMANGAHKAV